MRRKLVEVRKGTVLDNLCCYYKHHRLGVLKNISLVFTVLETRESKLRVLASSVLGEGFLPGL